MVDGYWRVFWKANSCRITECICSTKLFVSSSGKYSSSCAIRIWVSNSLAEPLAMLQNREKSFWEFLPWPSAMLLGIEIAQRLIWEVRLNFSSDGKFLVNFKVWIDNLKPSCQTLKSLKFMCRNYKPSTINHQPPYFFCNFSSTSPKISSPISSRRRRSPPLSTLKHCHRKSLSHRAKATSRTRCK